MYTVERIYTILKENSDTFGDLREKLSALYVKSYTGGNSLPHSYLTFLYKNKYITSEQFIHGSKAIQYGRNHRKYSNLCNILSLTVFEVQDFDFLLKEFTIDGIANIKALEESIYNYAPFRDKHFEGCTIDEYYTTLEQGLGYISEYLESNIEGTNVNFLEIITGLEERLNKKNPN